MRKYIFYIIHGHEFSFRFNAFSIEKYYTPYDLLRTNVTIFSIYAGIYMPQSENICVHISRYSQSQQSNNKTILLKVRKQTATIFQSKELNVDWGYQKDEEGRC